MIRVITFIAALLSSAVQSSYLGTNVLPLREGNSEIHGRVLDALSKTPVAGLEVLVFEVDAGGAGGVAPRPLGTVTHTDAAGRFSMTRIGAGLISNPGDGEDAPAHLLRSLRRASVRAVRTTSTRRCASPA